MNTDNREPNVRLFGYGMAENQRPDYSSFKMQHFSNATFNQAGHTVQSADSYKLSRTSADALNGWLPAPSSNTGPGMLGLTHNSRGLVAGNSGMTEFQNTTINRGDKVAFRSSVNEVDRPSQVPGSLRVSMGSRVESGGDVTIHRQSFDNEAGLDNLYKRVQENFELQKAYRIFQPNQKHLPDLSTTGPHRKPKLASELTDDPKSRLGGNYPRNWSGTFDRGSVGNDSKFSQDLGQRGDDYFSGGFMSLVKDCQEMEGSRDTRPRSNNHQEYGTRSGSNTFGEEDRGETLDQQLIRGVEVHEYSHMEGVRNVARVCAPENKKDAVHLGTDGGMGQAINFNASGIEIHRIKSRSNDVESAADSEYWHRVPKLFLSGDPGRVQKPPQIKTWTEGIASEDHMEAGNADGNRVKSLLPNTSISANALNDLSSIVDSEFITIFKAVTSAFGYLDKLNLVEKTKEQDAEKTLKDICLLSTWNDKGTENNAMTSRATGFEDFRHSALQSVRNPAGGDFLKEERESNWKDFVAKLDDQRAKKWTPQPQSSAKFSALDTGKSRLLEAGAFGEKIEKPKKTQKGQREFSVTKNEAFTVVDGVAKRRREWMSGEVRQVEGRKWRQKNNRRFAFEGKTHIMDGLLRAAERKTDSRNLTENLTEGRHEADSKRKWKAPEKNMCRNGSSADKQNLNFSTRGRASPLGEDARSRVFGKNKPRSSRYREEPMSRNEFGSREDLGHHRKTAREDLKFLDERHGFPEFEENQFTRSQSRIKGNNVHGDGFSPQHYDDLDLNDHRPSKKRFRSDLSDHRQPKAEKETFIDELYENFSVSSGDSTNLKSLCYSDLRRSNADRPSMVGRQHPKESRMDQPDRFHRLEQPDESFRKRNPRRRFTTFPDEHKLRDGRRSEYKSRQPLGEDGSCEGRSTEGKSRCVRGDADYFERNKSRWTDETWKSRREREFPSDPFDENDDLSSGVAGFQSSAAKWKDRKKTSVRRQRFPSRASSGQRKEDRLRQSSAHINPGKSATSIEGALNAVIEKLLEVGPVVDPEADVELLNSLQKGERNQVMELQRITGIQCVTAIVRVLRALWDLEPQVVRSLGSLRPEDIRKLAR